MWLLCATTSSVTDNYLFLMYALQEAKSRVQFTHITKSVCPSSQHYMHFEKTHLNFFPCFSVSGTREYPQHTRGLSERVQSFIS